MTRQEQVSDRVRLNRRPERGRHDRASIFSVLDATPQCTVAYVIDGQPFVTPTLQWRDEEHVYWHGSRDGQMITAATDGAVCMNVSLLDAFVLGRTAFGHSVNYRSLTLFGRPTAIHAEQEKQAHMRALIERLFPGRWDTIAPPTAAQLGAITVLKMPVDEASAKVKSGPVADGATVTETPVWAGLLPVAMNTLAPVADPHNASDVAVPDCVTGFSIGGASS